MPTERIDLIDRMQGPVGLPVLMRWTNGVEAGRGLGSKALRGALGFEDEMCRGPGSEALVGVAVRQILEVWCCYRDAIIYSL